MMSAVATLEPKLVSALQRAVDVLTQDATFEIASDVAERLRELGEKKDACTPAEREEHRRWAELWRKATLRKLQALNALKDLKEQAPELVPSLPVGADAA